MSIEVYDLAIVSDETPDSRSYSLDENKLVSWSHALPVLAGKILCIFSMVFHV